MIVRDLVESCEMMQGETKDGVFVVYERYENTECHYNGNRFSEKECEPEIRVEVLEEKNGGSLRRVVSYNINGETPVETVLTRIRSSHPDLLAPASLQAV
ncbi:hypothetical protein [Alteribacter natronophilus]|uniref:hypothetical protein n=1 Tax=Alteribacter natronophilus TaxID=2583810 RepID=UPI00110F16C7|nr:hypothetical protein [Alteribacter natronophilus]TMW73703.1 hypothetical protein FGB90_05260 [Alteribacter natronophilus]